MFEAYAQAVEAPAEVAPPTGSIEPDTLGDALQADPGLVLDKLQAWIEGFQRLLPNLVVALVVLLIFAALG